MKYQVLKIETGLKSEIAPGGSDLTIHEAESLLEELHLLEMCKLNTTVSPIVTLWHSTKLNAFAVSVKNRHYEYKIMQDVFSELGSIFRTEFNPQLN